MEWPNDMTISMITDIQNFPVLWDANNPYYKIAREKNDAWLNLASKYNTTPDEVKKKWQSLQASYRRERMKELTLSGVEDAEKESSKWFAYQAMAFVGDRYTPRKTKNMMQISESLEESDYRNNVSNHKHDEEDVVIVEGSPRADVVSEQDDSSPSSIPSKRAKFNHYTSPKSTLSRRQEGVPEAQDFYNIFKTTVAKKMSERDTNEVYGEYIAKTLRSLDSHSRIVAKHHINQILFDAELGRYRNSFVLGSKGSIYSSDVSDTSA